MSTTKPRLVLYYSTSGDPIHYRYKREILQRATDIIAIRKDVALTHDETDVVLIDTLVTPGGGEAGEDKTSVVFFPLDLVQLVSRLQSCAQD